MSFSKVQDAHNQGNFTGTTGMAVTISSTGGNTLIMTGDWFSGTTAETGISSVTDTAGNTWHYSTTDANNPPSAHSTGGGANYFGSFAAWSISASAVTSVTVKSPSSGQVFFNCVVSEWTGIIAADTGAAGTGTVPGNGQITPGSLTLGGGGGGELLAGAVDVLNNTVTGLPSGMQSFTSGASILEGWGAGFTGTVSPAWTGGTSGDTFTAAMMAFTAVLSIATTSLPGATTGSLYSAPMVAVGGTGGYTWSISSGSLPSWATLNAVTGVIAGPVPPGTAGTSSFTVKITDSSSNTATQALSITAAVPQPNGSPSGGPWQLVFQDEFDFPVQGPHTLVPSPALWASHLIWGDEWRTNSSGNDVWWSPHSMTGMSVANSALSITARHEDPTNPASLGYDPQCPANPSPISGTTLTYTAGVVCSFPSFGMSYGFMEARIQIPTATVGTWVSFYTNSDDAQWSQGPEFDIQEYLNTNSVTYWGGPGIGNIYSTSIPNADYTQWHTYGLRWSASDVTFFFDGTQFGTFTTAADITSKPMLAQLVFQVPNNQTGYPNYAGMPASYNADYVRCWNVQGVPAQPVITGLSPVNGVPSAGSVTVSFGAVSGATSYRVTSCPLDWQADGLPNRGATATGASSPLTVSGLTNGARYRFTVAAINATGYSIESATIPAIARPAAGVLMGGFP